jgi:hypothetical protein
MSDPDAGTYNVTVHDSNVDSVTSNNVVLTPTSGVPVAGVIGLGIAALASALAGVFTIRKKK